MLPASQSEEECKGLSTVRRACALGLYVVHVLTKPGHVITMHLLVSSYKI